MMQNKQAYVYAQQLITKLNGEGRVPFPFTKITEVYPRMDIRLIEFPSDVLGSLSHKNAASTIHINTVLSEELRQVVIAILLGIALLYPEVFEQGEMMVLHHPKGERAMRLVCASGHGATCLDDGMQFAYALLMPEDLTRKAWDTLGRIEEVAKVFRLPLSFVTDRLVSLGCVS